MGEMWVRLAMRRWDRTELLGLGCIDGKMVSPGNGCIGFLEVFESLESGKREYPDAEFLCIKPKEASDEQKES